MSQEELFALVDCVPSPIFVLDVRRDGPPVYAHYNKESLNRIGRPLTDFVGKTTAEAFGGEYGEAAVREQMQTITERRMRHYEFQLPLKGGLRLVRTALCPQFDDTGAVVRLIGSSEDISAEVLADAEHSKLQSFSTEVEQFVNMAAHDLRAPMRNVSMISQMLREGFSDMGDGKIELIDMLDETAGKAMSLISDVLAHANAVTQSDRNSLFDLHDLATDIHAILDPQKKHSLTCASLSLNAERTIFQIVLRNLMENALKHGRSDHLHLTCDARPLENDRIEITLSDDGAGFSDPGIAFLDSGDFRVDSGYGLLGIRRLIIARGGEISAYNGSDGTGSRVRFTLPGHSAVSRHDVVRLPRAHSTPRSDPDLKRHGA